MPFDPSKHHRRSIRLRGYDYSQAGAYFVTICVQLHQCTFGNVVDAKMQLSELGAIADECWQAIPQHFPKVELDEYVVMPNHLHGIMVIGRGVQLNAPTTDGPETNVPTETRDLSNPFSAMSPKRKTISVIVRTFKAAVTTRCREIDRADFAWQRNYYEHIIRNEREWNAIAEYIRNNPANWHCSSPKRSSKWSPDLPRHTRKAQRLTMGWDGWFCHQPNGGTMVLCRERVRFSFARITV